MKIVRYSTAEISHQGGALQIRVAPLGRSPHTSQGCCVTRGGCAAGFTRGVRRAVFVHLPEFALCVRFDGCIWVQPSVQVSQELIRGTVGAGDAFAAGVVFGIHEGWEPQRCLELGVCVAAASLRDATSSAAVEPWQECLCWGRSIGFHPLP
jgi:hypothetical protein